MIYNFTPIRTNYLDKIIYNLSSNPDTIVLKSQAFRLNLLETTISFFAFSLITYFLVQIILLFHYQKLEKITIKEFFYYFSIALVPYIFLMFSLSYFYLYYEDNFIYLFVALLNIFMGITIIFNRKLLRMELIK